MKFNEIFYDNPHRDVHSIYTENVLGVDDLGVKVNVDIYLTAVDQEIFNEEHKNILRSLSWYVFNFFIIRSMLKILKDLKQHAVYLESSGNLNLDILIEKAEKISFTFYQKYVTLLKETNFGDLGVEFATYFYTENSEVRNEIDFSYSPSLIRAFDLNCTDDWSCEFEILPVDDDYITYKLISLVPGIDGDYVKQREFKELSVVLPFLTFIHDKVIPLDVDHVEYEEINEFLELVINEIINLEGLTD